jgi:uncharacterized protein YfiM (DUF2279 family)
MFDLVKKLLIIVLIPLMVQAQVAEDSSHLNNNQPKWVAAGLAAGYTAGIVILSKYWYQQYPSEPFHFFNDNAEWLQMDKAGHLFTAYTAANWSHALWKTTGMNPRQSALAGAISSVVFVSALEVLDGHSSEWGFSGGDMLANLLGAGLMLGQEWGWNHQRIQLKFSYLPVDYSLTAVQGRADALFGSRGIEKMLKDYNGQTYWASVSLKPFFSHSKLPDWLSVAIGYGASGLFGGRENKATDPLGNTTFDRPDILRKRQWYLSPDNRYSH